MNNLMHYKGYYTKPEFDARDNILVGFLLGISDGVSFHADTVAEFTTAFHEAVDDYLEMCEKIGKPPQKTASGKMMLRVRPETHASALKAAQLSGKSLNKWAEDIIRAAVDG